jgi:hypothetical protein
MIELTGSEKQVNWGIKIREEKERLARKAVSAIDKVIQELQQEIEEYEDQELTPSETRYLAKLTARLEFAKQNKGVVREAIEKTMANKEAKYWIENRDYDFIKMLAEQIGVKPLDISRPSCDDPIVDLLRRIHNRI